MEGEWGVIFFFFFLGVLVGRVEDGEEEEEERGEGRGSGILGRSY